MSIEVGVLVEGIDGTGTVEIAAAAEAAGLDLVAIRASVDSALDVWTLASIPPNPQYLRLARLFAGTISRDAASLSMKLEGMPVYVEMNTTKHKKLQLLRVKGFTPGDDSGAEELQVGRVYAKAPGSDWLFE